MSTNTVINYLESGVGYATSNRNQTEHFLAAEAIAEGAVVALDLSQTDADRMLFVKEADATDTCPIGVALEAVAAGAKVKVCIKGICTAKVDGSATNIADGDALFITSTAGVAGARTDATGANLKPYIAVALVNSTAAESIEVYVCKNF